MDRTVSRTQVDHGKSHPFVMVRDEYLFLAGEDACAAALLAVLENWTNSLSKSRAGKWITRSHRLLSEDMLGLYSAKRIGSAVTLLVEKGYIQANVQPRSTSEFRLDACKINEDLRRYVPYRDRIAEENHLQAREKLPQSAAEEFLHATEELCQSIEEIPKSCGKTSDTIYSRLSNRLGQATSNRVCIDKADTLDFTLEEFLVSPERMQESERARIRFKILFEELTEPWDLSVSDDLLEMERLSRYLMERDLRESELEEFLGYIYAFIDALNDLQIS